MNEPVVAVLAPSMFLSVTIEEGSTPAVQEIHFHAAGQAIWIARMLAQLGVRPLVCAPLGGESGCALRGLALQWDIELATVVTGGESPAAVADRRRGTRRAVARSVNRTLTRHEADELYGLFLARSLAAGVCVIVGRYDAEDVPIDFYRRLGNDLAGTDVQVIGDLHGPELDALLTAGDLRWLKISDEDLLGGPSDRDGAEATIWEAAYALADRGCRGVIVSRADRPALALVEGTRFRVEGPALEVVEHRGAGDSMTAALAAAVVHGLPDVGALKLAWAAGAANVTRHGLGSASSDLIGSLAECAVVTELGRP